MTRAAALALSAFVLCSACQVVAGLWGSRNMGAAGADPGGCPGDAAELGPCGGSVAGGALNVSGGEASQGGKGGVSPSAGAGGVGGDAGAAASAGVAGEGGVGDGGTGSPPTPQSCDGVADCNGESACTTLRVPGGEFAMGRGDTGSDSFIGQADEQPEHSVTLSPFWLDKYEVTVGRFRRFVASYDTWQPTANAGNHPRVLASGWKTDWTIPANRAALEQMLVEPPVGSDECDPSFRTWTAAAGNNECLPINCLDWYLSFAFCIWDGGRLPTEAEWEFAAAGGEENRLFPWGDQAPDNDLAVFSCQASVAGGAACSPADLRPIGSRGSSSYGRYGHADLAGSLLERTRDTFDSAFYSGPTASQKDVVNLALDATIPDGAARGGDFESDGSALRASYRTNIDRRLHDQTVGFRCARDQ
jgi:formylglycine-generating enzyme